MTKSPEPEAISLDEWLLEIDELQAANDELGKKAKTTQELAAESGLDTSTITNRLKKLHREGRLGVVQVERTRIDRRICRVPAYYVLKPPKVKKKK